MPFCVKCGYEIPVGAAFCTSCGAPVTSVVAAPPVESVLFAIGGKKVGFGASSHLLAFTDRRLIVADVGSGAVHLLLSGGLMDMYDGRKIEKMKGKSIEELLVDEKSYAIPYGEINIIGVEKGGRFKSGSIQVNRTVGKPERFDVDIKKRIDDFERLLRPVLRERLVIKRSGARVRKLSDLRNSGDITEEQYQQLKARLRQE